VFKTGGGSQLFAQVAADPSLIDSLEPSLQKALKDPLESMPAPLRFCGITIHHKTQGLFITCKKCIFSLMYKYKFTRNGMELKKTQVAIIGLGYWGKKLVRTFDNIECSIVIYDQNIEAVRALDNGKYQIAESLDDILNNEEIQAVVIATPSASHFNLAKRFLNSGKNVWIEKPMTIAANDAQELVDLAEEKHLLINVDHTFLYTAAVQKIKQIVDSGELGNIKLITSSRTNFGLIQPDVDVVYDLAVHDLAIIDYVLGSQKVLRVEGQGSSFVTKGTRNEKTESAMIHLGYENDTQAQIFVSWLSPIKTRTMVFVGTNKYLVFDDTQTERKVVVYDQRINLNKDTGLVSYENNGESVVPINSNDALIDEARSFVEAINKEGTVLTSGQSGANVVALLERISQII
jgi:predicted dehydrogenase